MKNYIHRNDCRLCGSLNLDPVLPILPSAVGDAFVPKESLDETQEIYPLTTYLCLDCGHLQNLDIVDPDILFRKYTYKTSSSLGLVEHFAQYANAVVADLHLKEGAFVVELGSNDGSLLRQFKRHGLSVLGVDPARDIAISTSESGIPTIPEFFTEDLAIKIAAEHGKANLICANNVFAHVDDIASVVKGIRHLLLSSGAFVFEVSYVPDIIDNFVFDTIYHEHVSHHSLIPLEKFFNKLDMTLFDVKRVKSKGGSIRGFAQPLNTGRREKTSQLLDLITEEQRRGIMNPEIYRNFFTAIETRKQSVLDHIDRLLAEGKTIAAYGASTTTTTLLYHFELGERISYIVDDNPIKQGLFSPGYHLPVLSSSELLNRKPDAVVILAWIYADVIIEKCQAYISAGGEFIVPLPDVRIVNQQTMRESDESIECTGT